MAAAEVPIADLDTRVAAVLRRVFVGTAVSPLLFSSTVAEVTAQASGHRAMGSKLTWKRTEAVFLPSFLALPAPKSAQVILGKAANTLLSTTLRANLPS